MQRDATQNNTGGCWADRASTRAETFESNQQNCHATIQYGYYYSVATTTGGNYYGWQLLQVPSVSYFTWGPQSGGIFYCISRGAQTRTHVKYDTEWLSDCGPHVKYDTEWLLLRAAITTTATTTTAATIEDGRKARTGAEASQGNQAK